MFLAKFKRGNWIACLYSEEVYFIPINNFFIIVKIERQPSKYKKYYSHDTWHIIYNNKKMVMYSMPTTEDTIIRDDIFILQLNENHEKLIKLLYL